MSRLAVVIVALLVVLAGCGGFSGGSDEPDRELYGVEEQVTASTGEREGEELLPGLTTAGLTDPEALREAHLEVIDNRSHTVRATTEYVVKMGNETTREVVEWTIRVDPEAGVVFEVIDGSTDGNGSASLFGIERNRTEERWFGDRTLFRTEYEDGTVEYLASEEVEMVTEERMVRASQLLFGPLGGTEGTDSRELPTVGAVEAEDGTYYVVERHENAPAEGGTESTDVRTLVREDGLVRQTVFERVSIEDEGRTTVNRTIEIVDVGETAVERPDWYDDALEAGSREATDANGSGG